MTAISRSFDSSALIQFASSAGSNWPNFVSSPDAPSSGGPASPLLGERRELGREEQVVVELVDRVLDRDDVAELRGPDAVEPGLVREGHHRHLAERVGEDERLLARQDPRLPGEPGVRGVGHVRAPGLGDERVDGLGVGLELPDAVGQVERRVPDAPCPRRTSA
jgi:hypothetical protein